MNKQQLLLVKNLKLKVIILYFLVKDEELECIK